jgi:hypothetical protein
MLPAPGLWVLLGFAIWLLAGLFLAWVFGGASRLGGMKDPRIVCCAHGIPMRSPCDSCGRLAEAYKVRALTAAANVAATTVELNAEAQ